MPARIYMIAHCDSVEHPNGFPWTVLHLRHRERDMAAMNHAEETGHIVEISDIMALPATVVGELKKKYRGEWYEDLPDNGVPTQEVVQSAGQLDVDPHCG